MSPDQPHRYQPHPIPEKGGAKPGSLVYYRRFNTPERRGKFERDATQCHVCGCTERAPVHFLADWQPPGARTHHNVQDGA